MDNIKFEFNCRHYSVSHEVVEKDKVLLPNGILLEAVKIKTGKFENSQFIDIAYDYKINKEENNENIFLAEKCEPNIRFTFENQDYEVSLDTYFESKAIRLPDGRILHNTMWLESYPPKAAGLQVVESTKNQIEEATFAQKK